MENTQGENRQANQGNKHIPQICYQDRTVPLICQISDSNTCGLWIYHWKRQESVALLLLKNVNNLGSNLLNWIMIGKPANWSQKRHAEKNSKQCKYQLVKFLF